MSNFTPGPWKISRTAGRRHDLRRTISSSIYSKPGITDGRDCIVEVFGLSIENTEANAHLIAAAPELYKACKMAIEATGGSKHWQGETEKFLLAMETALAKAEGKEA